MKNRGLTPDPVVTRGGLHVDHRDEIEYFENNRVYAFQIESNLACPQGCLYCYAGDASLPMEELPGEDIMSLLEAAAGMDVKAIDWLGGDPLVRPDWYDLMKHAGELGLTNNIWTSGIPLEDPVTARKAVEVTENGFISVHLDTLDENIYRQLHRGEPGRKIQSILHGVDTVISLGKDPAEMVNCITYTRPVAGDVEKTIRFFHEKGMQTCLTQMCGAGLATQHRDWVPGPDEVRTACTIRDMVDYPSSTKSFCTMDVNKFYCGGIVCITVAGDVTPCSVIRRGVGNIHDRPIEDIIEEHRDELLLTRLRDKDNLPGHCSSCENNDVCWGCRATAFIETGDLFGPDPKCYQT